jgi:hypothetical protein
MTRSVVALLLLSLLSLSLLSTSSAAVCGGAGFDLSSITFSDLFYNDTAHSYGWYFHPCGNVTTTGCQNLESTTPGGTMMCQLPYSGPPGYSVATWVPEATQYQTTWTPYGGNGGNGQNRGVRMVLQDGASCGSFLRSLTVNFQCSNQAAGIAQMTLVNETSTCNYVATVLTSATCTGPSTGNGQVACGTRGLDLSSITSTDLVYKDTAKNYTYYFRPCGVVTSPQCANNPYGDVAGEAMMCQATGLYGELDQNTYDIAWWNPTLASWRRFTSAQYSAYGWIMTIADGVSCGAVGSRVLTVYYICAPTYTTPVFVNMNETSTCNYAAYILTSVACNTTGSVNTATESCGGQYDLTFATQRDLIYQPVGSTAYYVFRPCGVADNAQCQANANTNQSMMCQAYQGSTSTYDIAIWNPTAVSYTPTLTGLSMSIQDGEFCGADNALRSLTVNFVCQRGPPQSIAFTNFQEPSTCQYVATVTTPAVCRTGVQNGLCGSQGYDFSLTPGTDYALVSSNSAYTFYFNPCGQVNAQQCNNNTATVSSMMCQAVNGAATTYDIAYYDYQLVAWYKTVTGMQMFVQDGQSCNIAGQVYDRALTVNFVCGTAPVFNNLTEDATTPCSYTAYITTPQACAPVATGGSTGIALPAQSSGGAAYQAVTKCGGPYNLLPLSTSDLVYYPANQEYKWTLRVCGAVTSDANCTAAAVNTPGGYMLCQDSQYGYGAYEASTYNQYQARWAASRNGVIMTLADGAPCGSGVRTTRVFFQCQASATTASIYNITESPQCFYNVYVYTNLVCPTGPTTCGGAGYDLSALTTRGDLTYDDTANGYHCQLHSPSPLLPPRPLFSVTHSPVFPLSFP